MMSNAWKRYFDRVIPIKSINKLLVYTDCNREWIANPLIDLAIDMGWKVSMAFTDDFEEEDMNDISSSLLSISSDTLIISIISPTNPNLNKLNTIFPYYGSLLGFTGISIVVSPELPDSFILDFLRFDPHVVEDRLQKLLTIGSANKNIHVKSIWGSNFQFQSNGVSEDLNSIDDGETNSIAFPGMEVFIEVLPNSLFGEMIVYGFILPFHDQENNLIDHYGLVSENARFKISLQNGIITNIAMLAGCNDDFIYKRFKLLLGDFEKSLKLKVSFGIGHSYHKPPGIAIVDRNINKSFSMTINDQINIILYDVDLE
ncbi:MAG: hypothetical protein GPJ54_22370 [Candidatus Heimdallarchaeota archaeon]|nr:hypothetical protein [Candidatus Heimdallarchaeota archaeon]